MENASVIPDNMDFDASQLASVSLLPNKLTIYLLNIQFITGLILHCYVYVIQS